MHSIQLLNYDIEYFQYKAPKVAKGTIFFCNGFAGAPDIFNVVQAHFLDYDFYTINYPGHGQSKAFVVEDFDIRLYAQIVLAFIKTKKLKQIILVGLSLGGAIASLAYEKAPKLFRKVMLIAPVNLTTYDLAAKLEQLFFPYSLEQWIELAKKTYYDVENTKLNNPQFMMEKKMWIERILKNDFFAQGQKHLAKGVYDLEILTTVDHAMKALPKKTFLVCGTEDQIINQNKIWDYFQTKFPQVKQFKIANADHVVFNYDLVKFLKIFNKFLSL